MVMGMRMCVCPCVCLRDWVVVVVVVVRGRVCVISHLWGFGRRRGANAMRVCVCVPEALWGGGVCVLPSREATALAARGNEVWLVVCVG